MSQKYDDTDVIITLELSVDKEKLEAFNRLGLSEKARRYLLSHEVQDIMEMVYRDDWAEHLAWYVKHAATLPDAPKTVILPVALPAEVAAKYRVRCSDVGQDDLSAQASKDLTDLANSW